MKRKHQVPWLSTRFVLIISGTLLWAPVSGDEDALLSKSRALTDQYATELQAALQDAMRTGGPVTAIGVCKTIAPQIASKLSRISGASVTRTSLRFRNPGNAPINWQETVLSEFDMAPAEARPLEFFERTGNNGARYMKAIPTGGVCLACHGTALAPEIQQQLDRDYPHDRARGYELGDIRGAFSITWPKDDADRVR